MSFKHTQHILSMDESFSLMKFEWNNSRNRLFFWKPDKTHSINLIAYPCWDNFHAYNEGFIGSAYRTTHICSNVAKFSFWTPCDTCVGAHIYAIPINSGEPWNKAPPTPNMSYSAHWSTGQEHDQGWFSQEPRKRTLPAIAKKGSLQIGLNGLLLFRSPAMSSLATTSKPYCKTRFKALSNFQSTGSWLKTATKNTPAFLHGAQHLFKGVLRG